MFGSEFWSAIAGAVVGGAISYAVQWQALKHDRNLRDKEAADLKEAVALRLLMNLQVMYNNLNSIASHVDRALQSAEEKGWEVWNALPPIPNLPRHVELSPEELMMLLQARQAPLFNRVRDIEMVHHALIESLKVYLTVRTELGRKMGAEMDGKIGTSRLSSDDLIRLGPLIADVSGLAQSIAETARDDADDAKDVWKEYRDLLPALIGKTLTIEFRNGS